MKKLLCLVAVIGTLAVGAVSARNYHETAPPRDATVSISETMDNSFTSLTLESSYVDISKAVLILTPDQENSFLHGVVLVAPYYGEPGNAILAKTEPSSSTVRLWRSGARLGLKRLHGSSLDNYI